MTGPAGTLFSYRPDVLHRGSRMTGERSARFTVSAHYDVWAPRWTGRIAWPAHALGPEWCELIERATPRERSVFGFPVPGHPYWDEQTLVDTQARLPPGRLDPLRLNDLEPRGVGRHPTRICRSKEEGCLVSSLTVRWPVSSSGSAIRRLPVRTAPHFVPISQRTTSSTDPAAT